MHKNTDFREDINELKKPIYERDGKKAFDIPNDMTLEDFETFLTDLSISSTTAREAVLDLGDLRNEYGDKYMRYILCVLDNKEVFILVIDNRFHGESNLSDIVNCSGKDFRYHIKTMLLNPFIAEVLNALGAELWYDDTSINAIDTILEFSKVYGDNKKAVDLVLEIIRFLKFNHPFDYEESVTLHIIDLFTKDPNDLIDNLNYEIDDIEDEPSIHDGQELIDELNNMFDSSVFIESNK